MSFASGDLTTLATAQAYAPSGPSAAVLGGLITRVSRWILNSLNRPFILPKSYAEYFDGSGNATLVLPNWPVLGLTSLEIDGATVPVPDSVGSFGWTLQPWDGVPPGMPAVLELTGYRFWRGGRSTVVNYSAGYQVTDEAASIPLATGPYIVTPRQPYGIWASDQGVTLADGTPLIAIASGTPTTGQYKPPAPDAATPVLSYTFAAADAGTAILLSYGFIPSDLEQVVLEALLERSAYRNRPGIRSQSLAGQETISYQMLGFSDFSTSVLNAYKSVLPPPMGSF